MHVSSTIGCQTILVEPPNAMFLQIDFRKGHPLTNNVKVNNCQYVIQVKIIRLPSSPAPGKICLHRILCIPNGARGGGKLPH